MSPRRTLADAAPDSPQAAPHKPIKKLIKKSKSGPKPKVATKLPRLTARQVLAWLQRHPSFFQTQSTALTSLMLPNKAGNILSLHGAKAEKATSQFTSLQTRHKQLIATAKANQQAAEALFALTQQLLAATTMAQLRQALTEHTPAQLLVDHVRLFTVGPEDTAITLTAATIQGLCPTPVVLTPRHIATHRPFLGAKTAQAHSLALLHLTSLSGATQGLLVLASHSPTRFHAGQDTLYASFLAQTLGQLLANLTPTSPHA